MGFLGTVFNYLMGRPGGNDPRVAAETRKLLSRHSSERLAAAQKWNRDRVKLNKSINKSEKKFRTALWQHKVPLWKVKDKEGAVDLLNKKLVKERGIAKRKLASEHHKEFGSMHDTFRQERRNEDPRQFDR